MLCDMEERSLDCRNEELRQLATGDISVLNISMSRLKDMEESFQEKVLDEVPSSTTQLQFLVPTPSEEELLKRSTSLLDSIMQPEEGKVSYKKTSGMTDSDIEETFCKFLTQEEAKHDEADPTKGAKTFLKKHRELVDFCSRDRESKTDLKLMYWMFPQNQAWIQQHNTNHDDEFGTVTSEVLSENSNDYSEYEYEIDNG